MLARGFTGSTAGADARFGLVMYLPVYYGTRPASVVERRAQLMGFVNVVLRIDDMMAGMMAEPIAAGLRIRIHDRGAISATQPVSETTLFYSTPGTSPADSELAFHEWRPRHDHDLTVGGRQWTLEFEGPTGLSPWLRPLPLLVLCAGLLVSLILYTILARSPARARGPSSSPASTDDRARALVHAA